MSKFNVANTYEGVGTTVVLVPIRAATISFMFLTGYGAANAHPDR
jgi:hypothetical protein